MGSLADFFSGRKNPAAEGVVGRAVSGRRKQLDELEAAALNPTPEQQKKDAELEEARKKALVKKLRGE